MSSPDQTPAIPPRPEGQPERTPLQSGEGQPVNNQPHTQPQAMAAPPTQPFDHTQPGHNHGGPNQPGVPVPGAQVPGARTQGGYETRPPGVVPLNVQAPGRPGVPNGAPKKKTWATLGKTARGWVVAGAAVLLLLVGGGGGYAIGATTAHQSHNTRFGQFQNGTDGTGGNGQYRHRFGGGTGTAPGGPGSGTNGGTDGSSGGNGSGYSGPGQ